MGKKDIHVQLDLFESVPTVDSMQMPHVLARMFVDSTYKDNPKIQSSEMARAARKCVHDNIRPETIKQLIRQLKLSPEEKHNAVANVDNAWKNLAARKQRTKTRESVDYMLVPGRSSTQPTPPSQAQSTDSSPPHIPAEANGQLVQ